MFSTYNIHVPNMNASTRLQENIRVLAFPVKRKLGGHATRVPLGLEFL